MSVADAILPDTKLKLFADIDPDGTSEAYVPIRWCVTPALIELVKQHGMGNPHLLIVVRPYVLRDIGDGEETRVYARETKRYIVPLMRELQYVSFSRPGHNSVFATVVWGNSGQGDGYLDRALRGGGYDSVFTYEGELNAKRYHSNYVFKKHYEASVLYEVQDEITVTVPQAMFADEPPQWKRQLVDKFFDSGEFDECHMRGRWWFFTLPFSVIYFPFAYVARVVQVLYGLLFGLRRMSYKGFVHPIKYGFTDVVSNTKESIWWFDKNGEERNPVQWLLNPVTPLAVALFFFGIGSIHDKHGDPIWGHSWWTSVKISLLIHLGIFAAIVVLALLVGLVGAVFGSGPVDWVKKRFEDWLQIHDANKAAKKVKEQQEMLQALEAMACSQTSAEVSVDALPKEKQTFRLRFQQTKGKVCKPFAR